MKLIFGEMAAILLKGSKVSAEKILAAGFTFKYPDLKSAFTDILKK